VPRFKAKPEADQKGLQAPYTQDTA